MEQLVRDSLAGLANEHHGTPVKADLRPLPDAWGDAALLRQVWVHLLSNAFKFTRRTAEPRVEIGFREAGTARMYYVSDNGVGYNPKYAEHLFGMFQRLHRPEDFEGLGTGLARVQRILQRHAGRVWADAEEDKGATFYFSLPKPESIEAT